MVDDQFRVVALPATIDGFDTPSVTVGCGAGGGGGGAAVTLTVTLPARLPPVPLQVSVYAVVAAGDTVSDPEVERVPLQPPLAAQLDAFVEAQLSVVL